MYIWQDVEKMHSVCLFQVTWRWYMIWWFLKWYILVKMNDAIKIKGMHLSRYKWTLFNLLRCWILLKSKCFSTPPSIYMPQTGRGAEYVHMYGTDTIKLDGHICVILQVARLADFSFMKERSANENLDFMTWFQFFSSTKWLHIYYIIYFQLYAFKKSF